MNEPDLAERGGALAGCHVSAYGKEFAIFRSFMRRTTRETMILAPGTAGESTIASDLLAASGPDADVVSYHYYGTLSERCIGKRAPEAALSEAWLSGTDRALSFYKTLPQKFQPGKPVWLTQT